MSKHVNWNDNTGRTPVKHLYTMMFFYMSIAFVGSAAENMLTGFGLYKPFWFINIGNLCMIIHIVGAYQVSEKQIPLSQNIRQTTYLSKPLELLTQ